MPRKLRIGRTALVQGGSGASSQRRRGGSRDGATTAPRGERHSQVDRGPAPNRQLKPRLQSPVRREEGEVQKVSDPIPERKFRYCLAILCPKCSNGDRVAISATTW